MVGTVDVERSFTLTRELGAPPEEIFAAWTEPAKLDWFMNAAEEDPVPPLELDLRPGGVWKVLMVVNAATRYTTGGVYLRIVPNESLVFIWGSDDGWPEIVRAHPERNPVVAVELAESAAGTRMVFHLELSAQLSARRVRHWWDEGIRDGWAQTLDRLAARYPA